MKKSYLITMPFTGIATREVVAESQEEAIDKFREEATIHDCNEWDFCEYIVKGNVFYGIQNEMEIEVEDLDDEEQDDD